MSALAGTRRARPWRPAALAGLLILSAAGTPAPAQAQEPAPTPVTGTESVVGAPTLTPGRWVDTYGPGTPGTRQYQVARQHPGSTLVVTAATADLKGGYDPPRVSFSTLDGSSCSALTGSSREEAAGVSIAQAAAGPIRSSGIDPEARCAQESRLLVAVESPDTLPAEPAPFHLTVVEIPAAESPQSLPSAPDSPAWVAPPQDTTGEEVTGGTGTEAGPLLEPGTYQSTIAPGQRLRFRVRADWGQTLSTTTSLTAAPVPSGASAPTLATTILGPNGAGAAVSVSGGPPNSRSLYSPGTVQVGAQAAPVMYHNLGESNADFGASQPGTYTVVVSISDTGASSTPLPFLLSLGVDGERDYVPSFPDGQQIDTGGFDDANFGLAAAQAEAADGTGSDDGGSTATTTGSGDTVLGLPRWTLVAALGGLGGLAMLIAVVLLATGRGRRP